MLKRTIKRLRPKLYKTLARHYGARTATRMLMKSGKMDGQELRKTVDDSSPAACFLFATSNQGQHFWFKVDRRVQYSRLKQRQFHNGKK